MRRSLTWLVTLPFAAASVLLGHALAYRLTGTPLASVHGYLDARAAGRASSSPRVALLGLAADARARRHSPVPLAALAVGRVRRAGAPRAPGPHGPRPVPPREPRASGSGSCCRLPLAAAIWIVSRRLAEDIAAPRAAPARRGSRACRSLLAPPAPAPAVARRRGGPSRRAARRASPDLVPARPARARAAHIDSGDSHAQALVTAIALVAVAVPAAAIAQPAATKPVVDLDHGRQRPARRRHQAARPSRRASTVRLVIRTNVGTQVHLHGYNIEKNVKKGVPTVIQFVAKVPGRFALELHPMDALLAQLTVTLITRSLPRVLAHGIGGVQDLPVPRWLFYWGGAFVLVVSFIAARRALEDAAARSATRTGATSAARFSRLVLGPLRIVAQALSVVLFVVVLAAALFGTTDSVREPRADVGLRHLLARAAAPLAPASATCGGRSARGGRSPTLFVWIWERLGREARPLAAYPERVRPLPGGGRALRVRRARAHATRTRPARGRSRSRSRSTRTSRSSACSRSGARRGRRAGEGFAILFAYIARIAPLVSREGRIRLRVPLTGLAGAERVPGLGRCSSPSRSARSGFDGYSRTITWQNLVARVEAPYVLNRPGHRASCSSRASTCSASFAAIAIVLAAFLAACAVARSTVKAPRSLAPEFVLSLVPIALVYAIAHYFSLFVIQGQYVVPLLSDPFGKGWDLFGTAGVHPEHRAPDAEHDLVRPGRRRSCSATWPASPSPTTGR